MNEVTIALTDEEVAELEKFREKMISFNESRGELDIAESWRIGSLGTVAGTLLARKIREESEQNE